MIQKAILKFFIFLAGNYFIKIILKEPLEYLKLSLLITSKIVVVDKLKNVLNSCSFKIVKLGKLYVLLNLQSGIENDLMGFVAGRKIFSKICNTSFFVLDIRVSEYIMFRSTKDTFVISLPMNTVCFN